MSDNRDFFPHEILQDTIIKSQNKSMASVKMLSILSLLGAAVFPICLICILIGGGKLVTGNMMLMSLGFLTKKVSVKLLACNWLIVSLGNLAGAVFMAYFLGHYVGLSEGAAAKTVAIAQAKVDMDFGRAFISAIACNWMVCMGIWFYFGSKFTSGRILAMWFPVMIFVLIGFQHFVANMFIIPAGI